MLQNKRPANLPEQYLTLFEAVDLVGMDIFGMEWSTDERDARALPMSDGEIETAAFRRTLDGGKGLTAEGYDVGITEEGYIEELKKRNQAPRRRWTGNSRLRELLCKDVKAYAFRERRSPDEINSAIWNGDYVEDLFIHGCIAIARKQNGEIDYFAPCKTGAGDCYWVVILRDQLERVLRGEAAEPILMSTGAPGAPSGIPVVMEEFTRRAEQKINKPSKRAEAAYLEDWYNRNVPKPRARLTAKTIASTYLSRPEYQKYFQILPKGPK